MKDLANKSQNIFVSASDIHVFSSAKTYKQQLLHLIEQAKSRIYITALYVQDDEAGREILHALYQQKQKNPQLDIKIFVDFHRAQRGLIGEKESLGNRALYLSLTEQYQESIGIYGVAVKRKELFGVLHLKGMVFDDQLFYTGASINDIYFHQLNRYRLDRYYQINSAVLSDSFCQYLSKTFVESTLAPLLNISFIPSAIEQKHNIVKLKALLKKATYPVDNLFVDTEQKSGVIHDQVRIKPLVGYGRRHNKLNQNIRQMVQNSQHSVLMFTPYFNLPPVLARDVVKAIKRGVKVTLIVGDKTANDFYIADENEFSTIGIVPYMYEILLKRFLKRWQKFIDSGLLNIHLWQDADNSFHLKGIVTDRRYHLLTGSNLNPRAWSLDLENGLLLDDVSEKLMTEVDKEVVQIMQHTHRINHFSDVDGLSDYPIKPQKLLKKIKLTQIDKILKRFL